MLFSIFMMTIADLRCEFVVWNICCRGKKVTEFFEEEMASMFGKEKSVDTHFCQKLVSVSLHYTVY